PERAVRRTIVDADHLLERVGLIQSRCDGLGYERLGVIAGDDDGAGRTRCAHQFGELLLKRSARMRPFSRKRPERSAVAASSSALSSSYRAAAVSACSLSHRADTASTVVQKPSCPIEAM